MLAFLLTRPVSLYRSVFPRHKIDEIGREYVTDGNMNLRLLEINLYLSKYLLIGKKREMRMCN